MANSSAAPLKNQHVTPTVCVSEDFHGLPTQRITTAWGDALRVARQGAHVLSWVSCGRERLYLSPENDYDGQTPIRGGVPVCFPQFNQRGSLPKHGFARQIEWQLAGLEARADQATLKFRLQSSDLTKQWWAQAFDAQMHLHMTAGELLLTLQVVNTDAQPLSFSGALHTYLAVEAIEKTQLSGLGGQAQWDAVHDVHGHADSTLQFVSEFDCVYAATMQPLYLRDGQSVLEITQSASWGQTVVWNPGAEKSGTMPNLPANGYQQFLCVEAAQVYSPLVIAAGAQWQGWQRLRVLDELRNE